MTDEEIMRACLSEANKALEFKDVPIGAAVALDGEIISLAFNRREADDDPTAHAEILALKAAAKALGRWNLTGCDLFVTLEPCAMCAGAAVYSRIKRIVFGAYDERFGCCGSVMNIADSELLNHRCTLVGGLLKDECLSPIRSFFAALRKKS